MMNEKEVMKVLKKLDIPKQFWPTWVEAIFTHDYTILLSIRKDSAKTTNALLLGLVLYYLYGYKTAYMRSDEVQTRRAGIESLYDVIKGYKDGKGKNYIEKLYDGKYNSIKYKPNVKKFVLCLVDADGNIQKEDNQNCCQVFTLERSIDYKSAVNDLLNFIVFDEFMDTNRAFGRQMVELQDNISTFGREREDVRVLMLGNNVNRYNGWFEEFRIQDEIQYQLNYGGVIERSTELGTTLWCSLLGLSEEKKRDLKNRKIRFSGFNTDNMNAFNGLGTWRGDMHPHIPDDEWINPEEIATNLFVISHRNLYVQLNVYCSEEHGLFVFCHKINEPDENKRILTLTPKKFTDIYGSGQTCLNTDVKNCLIKIFNLRRANQWYYATNLIGDLIDDYVKNIR